MRCCGNLKDGFVLRENEQAGYYREDLGYHCRIQNHQLSTTDMIAKAWQATKNDDYDWPLLPLMLVDEANHLAICIVCFPPSTSIHPALNTPPLMEQKPQALII
jgi:hypothetical protein